MLPLGCLITSFAGSYPPSHSPTYPHVPIFYLPSFIRKGNTTTKVCVTSDSLLSMFIFLLTAPFDLICNRTSPLTSPFLLFLFEDSASPLDYDTFNETYLRFYHTRRRSRSSERRTEKTVLPSLPIYETATPSCCSKPAGARIYSLTCPNRPPLHRIAQYPPSFFLSISIFMCRH